MRSSQHLYVSLLLVCVSLMVAGGASAQTTSCDRVERRINSIKDGIQAYYRGIRTTEAELAAAKQSGNRARIAGAQQKLDTQHANLKKTSDTLYELNTWYSSNCGLDPRLPIINGRWNSTEGTADITQAGSNVTVVVHYATGGSSTLTGRFQGKDRVTFTWRNTFGHHGTGGLTLVTNPAAPGVVTRMTGWWIDKSLRPFKQGKWSLWQ